MLDQDEDNDQERDSHYSLTITDYIERFRDKHTDLQEIEKQYREFQKVPGFINAFHSWSPNTQHATIRWVQLGLDHKSIASVITLRQELQREYPNYDWSQTPTHGLKELVIKLLKVEPDDFKEIIFDFASFQRSEPTRKLSVERLAIYDMNETGVLLLMMIYSVDVVSDAIKAWVENHTSREFHHFVELVENWERWCDYPIDWSISTLG